MSKIIYAADLFCGAGGTSTGLYRACLELGRPVDLVAVNHWDVAVNSHKANHPGARHICASIDSVNPREAVPSRKLDILVASPECIFHSNARGGKPIKEQQRSSAWCVLRWAEALTPNNILIENVPEFQNWGPLGVNGRPLISKKGETYRAYLNALRSLGYKLDERILNTADYGDPTSRKRLFIIARRGRRKIKWPEPTHSETGEPGLFENLDKWAPAKNIIDFSLPSKSIFNRKKPLAKATIARIAAGLTKYGGKNAEPFLVMLYGTNDARSLDRPLPTVTAGGNHIGLCEPFLVKYHGNHQGQTDGEKRVHSVKDPIPTLDTSNRFGLVEPFITILKGQSTVRSIDNPLPTITSNAHLYLCEPFVVNYNGKGTAKSIDKPLATITTKDRFGLVEPVDLDIKFRMLQPKELAAAMSFPENYIFHGTKADQVRQIGNAVPERTSKALCESLLLN